MKTSKLKTALLFLALAAAAALASSCSQETPAGWSKGYPPQKPEGTVVNSPNWYQRL